jgi:hypothetical protein
MNKQTYQKLLATGDYNHNNWLNDVYNNFHPKRKGKYKLRITDTADLDDDIETGRYIETACFSTQEELSVIHYYFEGLCYILSYNDSGLVLSVGFMDGAIYDEIDEEDWEWLNADQLRALKLIPYPKIYNLIIQPNIISTKKYTATASIGGKVVTKTYDFKPRVAKAQEDLIEKYLKEVQQ